MRPRATLKPAVLKDLLSKDGVNSVRIQDAEGGFRILIGFSGEDKLLGLVKEDRARVFKTLRAAKAHLVRLGIEEARVDAPPTVPAKTRRRTVRSPRTMSEAALNAELEEALRQLDDGTAELVEWTPGFFHRMGAEIRAKYDAEGWPETRKTLDTHLLDVLAAYDGVESARIQPAEGGFCILISFEGKEEWVGYAKEDRPRLFKTLKSAKAYLIKLEIEEARIDAPPSAPAKTRQRRMRPPRIMSEAALNAELEEALRQLDDGTAELIECGPDIFTKIHAEICAKYDAEGWPEPPATMEPYLLETLVAYDDVASARIQSADGGFSIVIGYDGKEKPVGYAKEDRVRIFKTLKSAKAHLAKFGIEHYSVDETCPPRPEKPTKGLSLH